MTTKKKLTFKEYFNTKEQLLEAVKRTPKRTAEYTVRKYCKLPVGESKDTREYIPLKPKQVITVDWLYEDIDNPTPMGLRFQNVKNVEATNLYPTFWERQKLLKWLLRNAREES